MISNSITIENKYINVINISALINLFHFSTGQLSEAQEKAKNKTSHHFPIQPLEVTLPKQKLEIFRRCQIDGIEIDSELYGFERVMKMIQCKKSLLTGLIFYGNFWEFLAFTGS